MGCLRLGFNNLGNLDGRNIITNAKAAFCLRNLITREHDYFVPYSMKTYFKFIVSPQNGLDTIMLSLSININFKFFIHIVIFCSIIS